MGAQTPTGSDRSRTYWTPNMEHYFIDLLVDQMHRGNRIGHTFNKHAWTDMLVMFNSKFATQYEKDVLKNRYTNLWKQFNDIKNLLNQNGFSWDESRQMVTADDYVWDAYVKVHPDASVYKTKAVLNFNDLCLIYGYTTADGRYSRSSHDVNFEDEVRLANMGDAMGMLGPSRTDWSPEMDQYFIELMINQIGRRDKIENTFTKQAWTEMLSLFNERFGPQHGKRVLRHRYKKLWKYYNDIAVMLAQDGFSWDEEQQMLAADSDVWDAYVKKHPYARSYRTKSLPNYKDLGLIYGDAPNRVNCHLGQCKDFEDDVLRIQAERESQTRSNTDRSRTYWTPPMDRYLTDLLLEQVHKGNKLGQTFLTQGWIEVAKLFNENFGSHHDKEVLKNRHKHLRRQYNDVKVLLEQGGFYWDETRQMVNASDSIWDAYTKAHPDARSYRVKPVLSYKKLCLIYGDENINGGYSRLARNADSKIPAPLSGEEKNELYPTGACAATIDWTLQMDRHFIDLMLEQVHGGNKIDDTFNEQAWVHIITSFNEIFGLQDGKYELKNRYMVLMKQCDDINRILNQSGFAWDETRCTVVADDDVWDAYIKEHPNANLYRDKNFRDYNDLFMILGNGSSKERFSFQDFEIEIDDNSAALQMEMDGVPEDVKLPVRSSKLPDQVKKRKLDSNESPKMDTVGMQEMTGVIAALVGKRKDKSYISIESAIDTLQAIPDMDDDLLLDAFDLLEDERKAKTFMTLDDNLRKKWLLRELRSQ